MLIQRQKPSQSFERMPTASSHNFATCYIDLCKRQRLRPLPSICITLPNSLDFMTDRVKIDDWGPILNSLSLDRSLKSISVRSRHQYRKPTENIKAMSRIRKLQKPPFLTRYLLEWLSHSVAQCVRNSSALTCLQLEGVPLPADCLAALCVGLSGTVTLQHLSLRRCHIGDNCCAMICRTIADVHSIKSLNLSQCNLSENCGKALASALSRQKLLLYQDTWKDSLRYRQPNFQSMGGLRRLTLNGNPHLGNSAVVQIIDAIQDSLWLKAFDLQNCGLTDVIGNKMIQLLDYNKTLEVVDVRLNSNLSDNIVQNILKRLEDNKVGCQLEYRFLNLIQKSSKTVIKSTNTRQSNQSVVNRLTRPKNEVAKAANENPPQRLNSHLAKNSVGNGPKSIKIRSTLPPTTVFERKLSNQKPAFKGKTMKTSLHLDLQSQIHSVTAKPLVKVQKKINGMQDKSQKTDENVCQSGTPKKTSTIAEIITDYEDILQRLSEAKIEREKLLMATESMGRELIEERAKREASELKLWTMEQTLRNLESAFREKELESQERLFMNPQSPDEIAITFKELLEIFGDLSPRNSRRDIQSHDEKYYSDIHKCIKKFIRKTQSEKLYKKFDKAKATTKFSKSESLMKKLTSITSLSQLERNPIGDHPNIPIAILPENNKNCVKSHKSNAQFSPYERAHAIFSQVINGDIILNLDSHDS